MMPAGEAAMSRLIRPLLPVIGVALLLMAVLVLWIRAKPVDLSRTVQILLSILLVLAVGILIAAVVRVEHDTELQKHARGD